MSLIFCYSLSLFNFVLFISEKSIFSEIAGVYCLDGSSGWRALDQGVSRVNIFHNFALQRFRVLALSSDRQVPIKIIYISFEPNYSKEYILIFLFILILKNTKTLLDFRFSFLIVCFEYID